MYRTTRREGFLWHDGKEALLPSDVGTTRRRSLTVIRVRALDSIEANSCFLGQVGQQWPIWAYCSGIRGCHITALGVGNSRRRNFVRLIRPLSRKKDELTLALNRGFDVALGSRLYKNFCLARHFQRFLSRHLIQRVPIIGRNRQNVDPSAMDAIRPQLTFVKQCKVGIPMRAHKEIVGEEEASSTP